MSKQSTAVVVYNIYSVLFLYFGNNPQLRITFLGVGKSSVILDSCDTHCSLCVPCFVCVSHQRLVNSLLHTSVQVVAVISEERAGAD